MTTCNRLSYHHHHSNHGTLIAASGGVGIAELMAEAPEFHRLDELPAKTVAEAKALAWEPKLIEPAPNDTHETLIDEACKKARDLYEGSADAWPVSIWRWARGGYGYGHAIPEDTDVLLFVDGKLQAFQDGRAAR